MHKLEWPCRILLVLNCIIALSGYISFLQAHAQLVSPIIPSATIHLIVKQQMFNSLITGILFLMALLFYFFQKRMATIIISTFSILAYYYLLNLIQI
ncbi:hypothetical protein [Ferruginibacter profundus]